MGTQLSRGKIKKDDCPYQVLAAARQLWIIKNALFYDVGCCQGSGTIPGTKDIDFQGIYRKHII